jgi:hypothetical protein
MQKRAGLLYLSNTTERIMLVLEGRYWTVPTFIRANSVINDCQPVINNFSKGRILPIELYVSNDNGFEFGTFVCLVNEEFNTTSVDTIAWARLSNLPKNIHPGLKSTLANTITQAKIKTILELNLEINL